MEAKGKILIVDDELPVCKSISSALLSEGYQVDMAQSGEEALKMDEQNGFDVLLVDLMMPGMNGMELLEAIKKKRPDLMIIMITGYPTMKTAVQAVKLGAFDYLPKPFTPRELRALVARALSHRRLEGARAAAAGQGKPAQVPADRGTYCIPGHSWARLEEEGLVRVGVHETFLMTVGKLSSIDFPYEGERINQGEACLWLVDENQNLHRVWAPVSGKVVGVHKELQADVSKVLEDPYGSGWMLILEADRLEDDLTNLVPMEHLK